MNKEISTLLRSTAVHTDPRADGVKPDHYGLRAGRTRGHQRARNRTVLLKYRPSIKIGAVVPLTGRYAAGGEQVKNGYELAVDAINKAGGVDVGGNENSVGVDHTRRRV